MRFIHCADLHIGRNANGPQERYEDFIAAFSSLTQAAAREKADFILAAGDVFDTKSVSSATLWRVTSVLAGLKENGVRLFAIEGNHDKAFYYERDSWLNYLNNLGLLTLLKPDVEDDCLLLRAHENGAGAVCEDERCRIVGLGYSGALTEKRLEQAMAAMQRSDRFTIVMLHAALRRQLGEEMAGVERECLMRFREVADYMALGHIHQRYESDGFLYNPGSLEFVDSAEARRGDVKGYYMVDIAEDRRMQAVFVPVKTRAHVFIRVNIAGAASDEEARRRVLKKMAEAEGAQRPVIEIDLYGDTPLDTFRLDTARLEEEIGEKYDAVSVSVSALLVNAGARAEEEAHPGREEIETAVMRGVMSELGYGGAMAERMAQFALGVKQSAGGGGLSGAEAAELAMALAAGEAEDAH